MDEEEIILMDGQSTEWTESDNSELTEQLRLLNENLAAMQSTESDIEEDEEEGSLLDTAWSYLEFLDPTVDHTLYLSTEVRDATIDDVYSLVLSFRNIVLLGGFFFVALMLYKIVRGTMERLLSR